MAAKHDWCPTTRFCKSFGTSMEAAINDLLPFCSVRFREEAEPLAMGGIRPRAADDFDVVGAAAKKLRLRRERRCFQKAGLPSTDCWCIGGAPGGFNLSCSTASDSEDPCPLAT